jgi:hypothetical protein
MLDISIATKYYIILAYERCFIRKRDSDSETLEFIVGRTKNIDP